MSSKIPRGVHVPGEGKKTAQKPESKDSAILSTAANNVLKPDFKAQKENMPSRKGAAPKVPKGISTRHGQQVELKEQYHHLTAINEELQKQLSESRQQVAELELQFSELLSENAAIKKNLHDCRVLLVSAKIDPVLGEKVGDAAQHNEDKRKEAMSVSTDLLQELKAFSDTASQQQTQLKELWTTMEDITKARELMRQERENFSQQATEMENALKEAEALLL
ncbi:small kinetochore-associated protein isoform X1 [Nothobranchius furzeri]|uniref:Kinetochore-localized astrin/SPAG5 binding protein n=1 Tax=Nothobranchius furzeri TaxID=105023 RepID=A0A1A8AUK6_NOTFU|nr:transcript variant X3 [Nothobranchius furzeri]